MSIVLLKLIINGQKLKVSTIIKMNNNNNNKKKRQPLNKKKKQKLLYSH